MLWKALRKVHAPDENVAVEHRLEVGDPATQILRMAEETKAGLIIMGTYGRTGLGRLLLGSVAEHVLRKAPCPVLTVKMPFPAETSKPHALLPTSGGGTRE